MKHLAYSILSILIIDLIFSSCANPGNPTGGPKDTIPPTLTNSNPLNGSTNFSGEEIILEFSEYVNADKLTQNLIITPKTDIRFKHIIKKNQLYINFEEPFSDSTTYSLNFFDGVTDITEKNPAVNLVLAFSTGSFIDSIKVSGKVSDLLTQEPAEKFVVGLYPVSDSLDFLSHNPMYFTTTNDSGSFDISYIKAGLYRILSFNDANKNLLFDPLEEDHAFLVDTLNLTESMDQLELRSLLQNVRPIKLTNNRPVGNHHEIKYNKRIDTYSISLDSIYSSIEGTNKDIIRLYNNEQFNYGDSIPLIINVTDSLLNSAQDTLNIVFLESKRKSKELTTSISYNQKSIEDNPTYIISFNKPITTFDTTKLQYKVDSLFSFQPDSLSYSWNSDQTKLTLTTYLIKDTLLALYDLAYKQDSVSTDSTNAQTNATQSPTKPNLKSTTKKGKLEFALLKGTFLTVEKDTSALLTFEHQRTSRSTFGTLKLKIETKEQSFTTQLLSKSGQVKYESKNDPNPTFIVEPASYKVRILIDSNADGEWSYGNLLRNAEPEEIFLYSEEIPVRENWIVEDYTISF